MAKCGEKCEIYSRVCGYFRPVSNWNRGKQAEFSDRVTFNVEKAVKHGKMQG
ncbi:MAG: anaerobic ribonucleoside-triphosphate reductase [Victivallaceae bacterium]|nr:anaerobic ribonucleoside-triphosphate reductase [Victivallaceae bacterium]